MHDIFAVLCVGKFYVLTTLLLREHHDSQVDVWFNVPLNHLKGKQLVLFRAHINNRRTIQ